MRAGSLAAEDGLAVCYFVRRKRTPRRKADRIPPQVAFRLRRGRRFVSITLPTDVVEVGSIEGTGRRVSRGGRVVTTGAVIAWKAPGRSRRSWGVLTVGHGFAAPSRLAAPQRVVRIQGRGGASFSGTLLGRTPRRSRVDAAWIGVRRADLTAQRILPSHPSAPRKVRSVARLLEDLGASGATRPRRRDLPFRVHAFLPRFDLVRSLGSLRNVLSVIDAPAGAFAPGSSGSLFTVQGQPSAIQVAGTPDAFQRGFGQALADALDWVERDRKRRYPRSGSPVRLIAVF